MTLYRWRTQKDDKVRPSHEALEGKIFSTYKPPEIEPGWSANPGESANCRCWAEEIDIFSKDLTDNKQMQIKLQHTIKLSEDSEEASPLTEFKILNKGITPSKNGDILFDDKSVELVTKAYKDAGTQLFIDYNHKIEDAAGWFEPEIRDGELWATKVEWTEEALDLFSKKKYKYMSPIIGIDRVMEIDGKELFHVNELVNVALTNLPAITNQQKLVASRQLSFKENMELETFDKLKELAHSDLEAFDALLEEQKGLQAAADADKEDKPADDKPADSENKTDTKVANSVDINVTVDPKFTELLTNYNNVVIELKAFKDQAALIEKETIVKKLLADGKIMPADEKFFVSLSMDKLTEYNKTSVPNKVFTNHTPSKEETDPMAKWKALSAKEQKEWNDFGFSAKKLPPSFSKTTK